MTQLSKRARKRLNAALRKRGAILMPWEERGLTAEQARLFAVETARFNQLLVQGAEHDRRVMEIIETELPAIRADYRRIWRGEEE